jgi:ABC-type Fe3+/spermidine/putrescine transport system ATPase subunit
MLDVQQLSKRWRAAGGIDEITFAVSPGSYVVVAGQSGSGKTTLLRAIAGLMPIDTGRIVLDGADLTALPPHRRPISTVFQQFALFPHFTVARNIAFGLEQQRLEPGTIRLQVGAMLDLVGLTGTEHRMPTSLSGGQQQRVALARALAVRPQLVLLDEPLGALDPELRAGMRRELHRIQRESGVIFMHVSHDREEALTLADHLLVLHNGRILADGPPAQLRRHPSTARVAAIVGLDNAVADPAHPGQVMAFAAEHLQVVEHGWRGAVTAVHVLGGVTEREILLDTGELLRQRVISGAPERELTVGSVVQVAVAPEHVMRTVAG